MSAQRELSEKVTSRHWAWYLFAYCVQIFIIFFLIFFDGSLAAFCFHLERKCEADVFDISLLAWVFKGGWNNTKRDKLSCSTYSSLTTSTLSPTTFLFVMSELIACAAYESWWDFFSLSHPRPSWLQLAALAVTINNPTRLWSSLRNCHKKRGYED